MSTRSEQVTKMLANEEAIATLDTRVSALELLVAQLQARPAAAVAVAAASPYGQANGKQPHWMAFVRFGEKPCAGGCGTVILSGQQPGRGVWYEPKSGNTPRAQMFCEPCGKQRDPNGGV